MFRKPTDNAGAFKEKLDEAVGLTISKRLAIWPQALTLLQALLVQHMKDIQQRDELHGKLERFHRIKKMVNGSMTEGERDTMYLAMFELGEAILAPFGFDAGIPALRNQISVQEVSRRIVDDAEAREFKDICAKLSKMFPWPVTLTVAMDTVGDDKAETYWDGRTRTLTYSVDHMRMVRKNLNEQGVYITLVGQVLAAMMTGPKPVTDMLSALVLTAQLGIALGARDTFLDRSTRREPPDIYRGAADTLLRAVWNQAKTVAELAAIAPGADLQRIFQMFSADAATFKWKVVSNGPFLSIIAA